MRVLTRERTHYLFAKTKEERDNWVKHIKDVLTQFIRKSLRSANS